MNDLAFVEAVLQAIYPFMFLYAWYLVHRHNRRVEKVLFAKDGTDKLNGRLDQLIEAEKQLAFFRGKEEGIALGIVARKI